MSSILDFCKEHKPREDQIKGLQFIESYAGRLRKVREGFFVPIPIVMNCPTAWGKTFAAGTAAKWAAAHKLKVLIVTPQNAQIDQYKLCYPKFAVLKGKVNYPCPLDESGKTREDREKEKLCEKCEVSECPYDIVKQRALESDVVVANFHSYFYNKKILKADMIIVDEWHRLPDFLKNLSVITLSDGLHKEDFEDLTLKKVLRLVADAKKREIEKAEKETNPRKQAAIVTGCENKFFAVEQMFENSPENISFTIGVVEKNERGFRLKTPKKAIIISPINPNKMAIYGFFNNAKSLILMSGTGFESDEKKLKFFSPHRFMGISPIIPQRRPVFTLSGINVSHKKINDATIYVLAEHIRRIVRHHYPNRGIILSTYSMMKALKEALFEEHYVIHDVDGRKESIQLFKDSREYKIPILAASYEGLDFKDDIARFCIIPKVPFASLADASVKRTADRNMEQYIMDALTLIVQGSARVSRTETDYGVTYILDQSFMRVFEQFKHNLPLYFNEAVCHVGNLEDAFLNERVLVKNLKEGFYANKRL